MPSTTTRRLVQVPIRVLAAVIATIAAIAAVWYGGQTVLTWLGVANPTRGNTGTALGLGATAIGSSVVPGWLTARYYFVARDRLDNPSETADATETDDDADDPADSSADDIPDAAAGDSPDETPSDDSETIEIEVVEEETTDDDENSTTVTDSDDGDGTIVADVIGGTLRP